MADLPNYVWDTSAKGGRYRTLLADGRLGRFVANEFMADALREMATNGEEALFQLARAVRDGTLKPVEVQLASQIVLKDLYNAFTALAYGGWSNVPFAAWGRNGQILRYEYAYWRDFMREIMTDGAVWTDKALRARVALYIGKAFSRYWAEDRLQKLNDLDFTEERWYDVGDEKECFPAWTLVTTRHGPQPIQRVKTGDEVLTRAGWRLVLALHRKITHDGLRLIVTERGSMIATTDHPIWVVEKGWLECRYIERNDFLQAADNEPIKVLTTVDFSFYDSHNMPAITRQIAIFIRVALRIAMPKFAVDLQRDAKIAQQKVNAVAAKFSLLHKIQANLFQRDSHRGFDRTLALVAAITSDTTKACWTRRNDAKRSIALQAVDYARWPITFFRTVVTAACRSCRSQDEQLAAPVAIDVARGCQTASATTNCITTSYSLRYNECLTAARANFFNGLRTPSSFPASIRAEGALLSLRDFVNVESFPALLAIDHLPALSSRVVARGRAVIMRALTSTRNLKGRAAVLASILKHGSTSLMVLSLLYHQYRGIATTVYDLTVDDEHEFFANDVLVHNCDDCPAFAALNWVPLGTIKTVPGAGATECLGNCRCRMAYR